MKFYLEDPVEPISFNIWINSLNVYDKLLTWAVQLANEYNTTNADKKTTTIAPMRHIL